MTREIDLKKLERKVFTSHYEDGLWDLFFGFLFLGGVFIPMVSWLPMVLFSIIPQLVTGVIGCAILIAGKKYITTPRLGLFKYSQRQEARKKKIMLVLTIFSIIGAVLLILGLIFSITFPTVPQPELPVFLRTYNKYLTALGVGLLGFSLPLGVVSYFLKFDRGYIIALLGGMIFFLTEIFYIFVGTPLDTILTYGIIGGIILSMGLFYFLRFLRKHPLPKEEMVSGSE